MKKGVLKIAALCLAGATAFSAISYETAALSISDILPAAGSASVLKEGKSVEELRVAKESRQTVTVDIASAGKKSGRTASGKLELTAGGASVLGEIRSSSKEADSEGVSENGTENKSEGTTAGAAGGSSENSGESAGGGTVSENTGSSDSTGNTENTGTSESTGSAENNGESGNTESTENTGTSEGGVSSNTSSDSTASEGAGSQETDKTEGTQETTENQEEKSAVSENAAEEKKEEKLYSGRIVARVSYYVNVRSDASEESEVVGKLYDKSAGELLGEKNGWYKIKSGNVTGYVKAEYVVSGEEGEKLLKEVSNTMAVVNTTTLKVREAPSLNAAVLGLVPIEDRLLVLEDLGDWVKVSIEEGDGYISKEFVDITVEYVTAESVAEEKARLEKEEREREAAREAAAKKQEEREKARREEESKPKETSEESKKETKKETKKEEAPAPVISSGSGLGSSVASYAQQFVGNPYVYGGTSLTNGADCSGFVMSVYNNFGVSLPHSSGAQRSSGYSVGGLENAQAGDIVCYSGHVGIYIGGGQIVHASTPTSGIKISNANYRQVLSVRRIF